MTQEATHVELTGESLVGIDVFRTLSPDQRGELAQLCQGHRFAAQQQIVSHKDDNRDVFFIISGKVRVTIYSLAGKEITFRDQSAGEMFGELSAIDGKPRSAFVVALADTLIATMAEDVFWQVLRDYPAVAEATLKRLTNLVRLLSDRVFEFSALAVRNRIHAELLRLARGDPKGDNTAVISPAPTHADIASRVSTHREAVTRELNKLSQEGLLHRRSGELVINDIGRLTRMVQELTGE